MATQNGGSAVRSGYYFDSKSWEFTMIRNEGGTLPGPANRTFRRVPLPLLLMAAPLLGGLFVMFLPLIGFVMAIGYGLRAASRGLRALGSDIAASMSHDMVPGEAHFAGRDTQEGEPQSEEEGNKKLEALAREIEEKRNSHL